MRKNGISIALSIVALFVSTTLCSQDLTLIENSQEVIINEKSKVAEVKVEVTDDFNYLRINALCHVQKGQVLVELIDPSGEPRKKLILKSEIHGIHGDSHGHAEHSENAEHSEHSEHSENAENAKDAKEAQQAQEVKHETHNSMAKGVLENAFRIPQKGDWIVRITPVEAQGHFCIESVLIYNPRVDMLELFQIEEDTNSRIQK